MVCPSGSIMLMANILSLKLTDKFLTFWKGASSFLVHIRNVSSSFALSQIPSAQLFPVRKEKYKTAWWFGTSILFSH